MLAVCSARLCLFKRQSVGKVLSTKCPLWHTAHAARIWLGVARKAQCNIRQGRGWHQTLTYGGLTLRTPCGSKSLGQTGCSVCELADLQCIQVVLVAKRANCTHHKLRVGLLQGGHLAALVQRPLLSLGHVAYLLLEIEQPVPPPCRAQQRVRRDGQPLAGLDLESSSVSHHP